MSEGNVLTIVVDGTSYTVTVKAYDADAAMDTAKTAAEDAISTFNGTYGGTSTLADDVNGTTVTDTSYDDNAAETAIEAYEKLGASAAGLDGYDWYDAIQTQIDANASA